MSTLTKLITDRGTKDLDVVVQIMLLISYNPNKRLDFNGKDAEAIRNVVGLSQEKYQETVKYINKNYPSLFKSTKLKDGYVLKSSLVTKTINSYCRELSKDEVDTSEQFQADLVKAKKKEIEFGITVMKDGWEEFKEELLAMKEFKKYDSDSIERQRSSILDWKLDKGKNRKINDWKAFFRNCLRKGIKYLNEGGDDDAIEIGKNWDN